MNILVVHNFYQIGGGEHTVFENEVEMLQVKGNKVITYTKDNMIFKKSKFKQILLPLTTIWSFTTYFQIKKIIKKENIEVVHCHNTFPLVSPSVYYAAKKMGKPIFQTIHNFRMVCANGLCYRNGNICEECLNSGFRNALKNKCYRNSFIQTLVVVCMLKIHRMIGSYNIPVFIFLTEFNQKKITKYIHNNKFEIKPNFYRDTLSPDYSYDSNKFIYIGRLDDNKGILNLSELWKFVPEEDILHIYGDGLVKEKIIKLNLKNVVVHGFESHDNVLCSLKSACALIFPSECYEGFPMTIIESMSLGVPVITNKIGNHNQIIVDSVNGYHYDKDDYNDLINKLKLVKINRLKLSESTQTLFKKYYTEKINYDLLINIYTKRMEEAN